MVSVFLATASEAVLFYLTYPVSYWLRMHYPIYGALIMFYTFADCAQLNGCSCRFRSLPLLSLVYRRYNFLVMPALIARQYTVAAEC